MSALRSRSHVVQTGLGFGAMRIWPRRRWIVALAVTMLAALVMGVPTGVVSTSLYTRMTPVTWWDYPVWAISSLLVGLTAATYVRMIDRGAPSQPDAAARTMGASLLATFAIGCPICNKVVVAAIGVSGALSYWSPIQPVLGVLSIALLLTGLAVRMRGKIACPSPTG